MCLLLKGANAGEVAGILTGRLAELRCEAHVEAVSNHVECTLRISVERDQAVQDIVVELDSHDTADFAAEKVIDILAEQGVISLPTGAYTREEEERIRRRLQDLGYIE